MLDNAINYKEHKIYINYVEKERRFHGTTSINLEYKLHSSDYIKLLQSLTNLIDREEKEVQYK